MTGLTEWKPLLCSPSPRDLPEVRECHEKLFPKYDFLFAKYFIEREAYHHLRHFFLTHPDAQEYTHLIICPDDLLIKPENLEMLWQDLQQYDYPILSGIANVDLDTMRDYWSITENLPHPVRPLKKCDDPTRKRYFGWRWYSWFNSKTIKDEQLRLNQYPIFRVMHSGFALQCLRRDVVRRIEFTTDALENGITDSECSSVDVMFSNSCAIDGIAIMVDPRITMLHLRHGGPVEITLGDSEIWFVKEGVRYTYKSNITVPKRTKMVDPQTDLSS